MKISGIWYNFYCTIALQSIYTCHDNVVSYILQINLPNTVTEREGHSLSTFIMGPHCVWLIVLGGKLQYEGADVTDPNIIMLLELGK